MQESLTRNRSLDWALTYGVKSCMFSFRRDLCFFMSPSFLDLNFVFFFKRVIVKIFIYVHMCVHACVRWVHTCGGQERASESLYLELQMFGRYGTWVLRPEPRSAGGAASMVNSWAISPAPAYFIDIWVLDGKVCEWDESWMVGFRFGFKGYQVFF